MSCLPGAVGRGAGKRAFSLLELLVVIAIMGTLLSFTVPALTSVLEGGNITQAATIVANEFAVGHLAAMAADRPVTLRLIRQNTSSSFQYLQLLTADTGSNLVPMDRLASLPVSTAIAQSPTLSSLMNASAETAATASDPSLPVIGTNYRYIQFVFRPRGSLDLDITQKWFASVVLLRNDQTARSTPPANFVTLQIDPVNGNLFTFRP